MKCRILEKGECEITQEYNDNHLAVDIVGGGYTLDNVIAHTSGKVIFCQDGYGNMKGSTGDVSYGNCVKIDHGSGYATLYAHMLKGLKVKNGDYVEKGQILGYMSDSGNSYGSHTHFEVWKDNLRIDPTKYLNEDFTKPTEPVDTKYKIGDTVTINGVYISSTSTEKLIPKITTGVITKIIPNTNNPYLLNDGQIGWVNDNVIISKNNTIYLSNKSYNGVSIVDALNQIGVDSSFNYRFKLANINGISNYTGTAEQNTKMLEMLKKGTLKSV